MKIVICGSSAFRVKKVDLMDQLTELGHKAIIHPHYVESVKDGRKDIMDRIDKGECAQLKIEYDYIKWYYNAIKKSDAVLIVNLDKKDKKNYIGGNVLMELGFAHVLDKQIYLLNDIPKNSYKDEIIAVKPIILHGEIKKIK